MAMLGSAVVAVTAVATAGVAGTGGAGGANAVAAPGVRFLDARAIGATPTPSASPAPSAPAQNTPQLRITLAYERHDRSLVLTVIFDGYVYTPYDSKTGALWSYPTPAGRDIGLSEHLDWGDGTSYDAPNKPQRCPQGTEKRLAHQVKDNYQLKKKYRKGGDYTLSYRYVACGLTDGQIAGQLKLHVP